MSISTILQTPFTYATEVLASVAVLYSKLHIYKAKMIQTCSASHSLTPPQEEIAQNNHRTTQRRDPVPLATRVKE